MGIAAEIGLPHRGHRSASDCVRWVCRRVVWPIASLRAVIYTPSSITEIWWSTQYECVSDRRRRPRQPIEKPWVWANKNRSGGI